MTTCLGWRDRKVRTPGVSLSLGQEVTIIMSLKMIVRQVLLELYDECPADRAIMKGSGVAALKNLDI